MPASSKSDAVPEQDPLFYFEGKTPDGASHNVTGSFGEGDPVQLPDMPIDARVTMTVTGKVTAVNHKRDAKGALIRAHTIVLDGASNVKYLADVSKADQ